MNKPLIIRKVGNSLSLTISDIAKDMGLGEGDKVYAVRTPRGFELTPTHLAMTGIHPEFGRVTLAQHLSTWTVHDLTHLAQIVRVMAKQYGEAVGPWTKYLSVLQG